MTNFDDIRLDPHDPAVPPGVRAAVLARWQPGDSLWRCPRRAGRQGWFSSTPRIVIEWWLLDAGGDLVEAFWEE